MYRTQGTSPMSYRYLKINFRGDGGLDMDAFWKIVILVNVIMLVIFIPFEISRYEGDERASFVSLNFEDRH
jgi:hypothetical protein